MTVAIPETVPLFRPSRLPPGLPGRRRPFVPWASALAALAVAGCDVRDEPAASLAARTLSRTAPLPAERARGTIAYVEGYEAGLRRAATENRPLLVVFKAGWCRWCGEFTAGTLADPRVVELSRKFVCASVDADRHAEDCLRFGIREFPTVVITGPGGSRDERRWTGCPPPDEVMAAMEAALAAPRIATSASGSDAAPEWR